MKLWNNRSERVCELALSRSRRGQEADFGCNRFGQSASLPRRLRGARAAHGRQRACAILVVLVLLGAMALLVVANTTTLHLLNQELDQIDKQQQKKYGQGPGH